LPGGGREFGGGFKEESSFLKKRSKRLLRGCRGSIRRRTPSRKSFLVLFFKKERLAFSLSEI
jgi:hypothetical protein